ncbi:MAG TPA: hypothetical protein VNV43_11200 [Candidatus Acidoferrales bacterium]|nr:hypothetical protein [Candidatus Acidoferrales bacterium]
MGEISDIRAMVGTARCAVRAAFSGAMSVVDIEIEHIPPGFRAVTAQRAVPTNR